MNGQVGMPEGTAGTIKFEGMVEPKQGVRTDDGRYYVQSVNPHLWLLANIRNEQFTTA